MENGTLLAAVVQRLIAAGSADRVRLGGLKEERRAVIGGGLSILRAVFELLQVEKMQPARGALRQGLLYDLVEREPGEPDIRAATVQRMGLRFGVQPAQADRVAKVACQLLAELRPATVYGTGTPRLQRELQWAAQLHEIGSRISHSDCHKHGAYILDNADVPGFARTELHRLGLLVLGHRGKLRKIEADLSDGAFVHQLLSLRLAVITCVH
jgi:exopolyphosphatase/guanosine-5'-triphosphate,3'-diphosphate pyrophosphatase